MILTPKMTHGDIEDADITKVSTFVKDMTGIGVLVPDDGLEDYIRQIGHLPGRTTDTRTAGEARQPSEPQTAAGTNPKDKGEEIPDNAVKSAKKRLGRAER